MKKHRAQDEFLAMLNDITYAALEADDMRSMLQTLADRVGKLFAADDCFITLWDEEHQRTIPMVAYGPLSDRYVGMHHFEPGEHTLTGLVLGTGHALAIEDVKTSSLISPNVVADFSIQSALGLPLITKEKKLGAVIVSFKQPHHFTQEEIAHGELAAQHISLAVIKIHLLEEAQQRVKELAGLHEISQTFSLRGDLHETYDLLTRRLAFLICAPMCVIALIDPATNEVRAQSPACGMSAEQVAAFHYPAALGSDVWDFTERDVFRANSIAEIPKAFIPIMQSFGVESVIVAPMRAVDRPLLGMVFAANKPHGFSEDDARLMGIFVNRAIIVIQNTHLLAAERRRAEELDVLHSITISASEATSEDELIEHVTRLIGEKLYPDNFGILLYDEAAKVLRLHSSYHLGKREDPIVVSLSEGIVGHVASSGQPERIPDVTSVPYYLNVDSSARSELCVPLKIGERLIGVINVESAKLNAFTQEDEDLLTIMAGQLATAVEHLRASEAEYQWTVQVSRTNLLINALAEVAARVSAVTEMDMESIMVTLGAELKRLSLTCLIALYTPDAKDEVVIRYTSANPKIVRLIERAAHRKMHDFRVPAENFLQNVKKADKPSLLHDPLGAMTRFLYGFPEPVLERILKAIGVTGDTPICHLPFMAEKKMIGFLWLWGETLRESDLTTMSVFASQVAIAIRNAELFTEIQRLATTDDLTGVYNRRQFFALGHMEFNRARRYKRPLSALFLDFDDFKLVNDRYGHSNGDKVLRAAIDLCQCQMRDIDIFGRYGGDEFVVLLAETDQEAAYVVAERLRFLVAEMRVPAKDVVIRTTMSVGVAGMNEDTSDLAALIARADQAAYASKEAGRNRVAMK